jgi:hypothetical protein
MIPAFVPNPDVPPSGQRVRFPIHKKRKRSAGRRVFPSFLQYNPVRAVDAYIEGLDLSELGFGRDAAPQQFNGF